jgi:hypothetical protein
MATEIIARLKRKNYILTVLVAIMGVLLVLKRK